MDETVNVLFGFNVLRCKNRDKDWGLERGEVWVSLLFPKANRVGDSRCSDSLILIA